VIVRHKTHGGFEIFGDRSEGVEEAGGLARAGGEPGMIDWGTRRVQNSTDFARS